MMKQLKWRIADFLQISPAAAANMPLMSSVHSSGGVLQTGTVKPLQA